MAQVLEATLPAQTAGGADSTTAIGTVSNIQGTDNYLKTLTLTPPTGYATSAFNATNYVTFTAQYHRAGGAAVALGVFSTTATSLVAETAVNVPITATAAQQSGLTEGDLIEVLMHQVGTGVAVGVGIVCAVEIQ